MPSVSLKARLKQHWSQSGSGPDVQARLKAAQELLEQREAEEKARARGFASKTKGGAVTTAAVGSGTTEAAPTAARGAGDERKQRADASAADAGRGQVTNGTAAGCPQTGSCDNDAARLQGNGSDAPAAGPASAPASAVAAVSDPQHLKDAGNKALAAQDFATAVSLYSAALAHVSAAETTADDATAQLASALYCNRAAALLKLSKWAQAAVDAVEAGKHRPDWPKPLYRLAQALSGSGSHVKAMAVCRRGEKLLKCLGDHSREFTLLMDQVATSSALAGCLDVFDGREIRVRTAGEDAWLCLPAPPTAEEIEAEKRGTAALGWGDELGALAITGTETAGAAAQVVAAEAAAEAARKQAAQRTLSVRSIREAVEKARDGDVIIFEDGPHNVGGEAVVVDKRVLIRREGRVRRRRGAAEWWHRHSPVRHHRLQRRRSERGLGDSPVEQRGNAPAFRLTRSAVLKDLDLDLSGFRECVQVQGDARCAPVLLSCRLRSSGDHGFVAEGRCAPVIRRSEIRGRHAGVCTFDAAAPVFENCEISKSDMQGVRACDKSRPRLRRCTVSGNGHEGVVSMDAACVSLEGCVVTGNKGPGVDLSGEAAALLADCTVKDNCGGVFLWEDAKCSLQRSHIEGGSSHAILADEHTRPHARQCKLKGGVHALSTKAAEGIAPAHNAMLSGDKKSEVLPPESGCFKFEADRFTRKQ